MSGGFYVMGLKIDILGKRFGMLVVIGEGPKGKHGDHLRWLCRCDCGVTRLIIGKELRNGQKSCGCLNAEITRKRFTIHGHTSNRHDSSEYNSWRGMKERCNNPSHAEYHRYGGAGINYCKR